MRPLPVIQVDVYLPHIHRREKGLWDRREEDLPRKGRLAPFEQGHRRGYEQVGSRNVTRGQ